MKILAVADAEDRALRDHFDPGRWRGVDLIVSCGDLEPGYLDYLVSCLNVPCVYVRGNHDAKYAEHPPGGCEDVHGRVIRIGGLRIGGLEGSRWYGGRGVEVGERTMRWRAWRLRGRSLLAGGLDVLVAHSPPLYPDQVADLAAIEAGEQPAGAVDRVHLGFAALTDLTRAIRPKLFLHGHTHLGYGRGKREQRLGATRVIDCYGAYIVEV